MRARPTATAKNAVMTAAAAPVASVALTSGVMTVENYYGIFEAGETLTEYTGEGATGATGSTATLDSIATQSLAEAHPAIVSACEVQVRYYYKHTTDFENSGTDQNGNTIRRSNRVMNTTLLPLQEETMALLANYRRVRF